MIDSGAMLSGPCALLFLSFTVLELADSYFDLLIGESCGEKSVCVGASYKAVNSWLMFLLISLSRFQWCPFSIRTLAIAFVLMGQSGVFFAGPARWLKVCPAFLLE